MIATTSSNQAVPQLPIRYFSEPFYLDRTYLSGLAYYDYHLAYRSISNGDPLTLKREPNNKYDRFAVAVYFCGRKLGYWPFPENKAIANLMDRDVRVKARVVSIHPDKNEVYEALSAEAFVSM
ncbi:HIRAN domain-containing protein [Cryomorphaceae bacterium 1068]|nr:HIRAN domain-containing protein [Cryomorphaceae bacterium 1068]